jgi:hypothetical protein
MVTTKHWLNCNQKKWSKLRLQNAAKLSYLGTEARGQFRLLECFKRAMILFSFCFCFCFVLKKCYDSKQKVIMAQQHSKLAIFFDGLWMHSKQTSFFSEKQIQLKYCINSIMEKYPLRYNLFGANRLKKHGI